MTAALVLVVLYFIALVATMTRLAVVDIRSTRKD